MLLCYTVTFKIPTPPRKAGRGEEGNTLRGVQVCEGTKLELESGTCAAMMRLRLTDRTCSRSSMNIVSKNLLSLYFIIFFFF